MAFQSSELFITKDIQLYVKLGAGLLVSKGMAKRICCIAEIDLKTMPVHNFEQFSQLMGLGGLTMIFQKKWLTRCNSSAASLST